MKGRAVRRARVGAFSKAEGLAAAPVTRSQLPLPRPGAGSGPGSPPHHTASSQTGPRAFRCTGHCVAGLLSPDEL